MKRLLVLPCVIFAFETQAQITITNGDLPHAGDKYVVSDAAPTSVQTSDLATTGANANWNFNLQSTGQTTDTMFHMNDVPPVYFLTFLSSDYADHTSPGFSIGAPPTAGISVQDIYNFYNLTSTKLEQSGFGAAIDGLTVPVPFSPKDLIYQLPLHYNDTWSSNAHFNLPVPTLGSWDEVRVRTNTVDGWGTLAGPLGSQQVLRVVSDIVYQDSVYVDLLQFGIAVPRHQIEYKWLAANGGIPLLQIVTTVFGGNETVTSVTYKEFPTGVEETLANNMAMTLYPQPATNRVTVVNPYVGENDVRMTLCDATGRVLTNDVVKQTSMFNVDVSSLPAGVYMLTLQSGSKSFTRRVAVTR